MYFVFVETTHAFCSFISLSRAAQRLRGALVDQTRARRALDLLPREAPPHVVELRGGADLARAARASDPQARLLIFVQPDLRI